MTDIAREAGCSQATVSFVLNRTAGIKISQADAGQVIEARGSRLCRGQFRDLQRPTAGAGVRRADRLCGRPAATSRRRFVAIEGARQAAWVRETSF